MAVFFLSIAATERKYVEKMKGKKSSIFDKNHWLYTHCVYGQIVAFSPNEFLADSYTMTPKHHENHYRVWNKHV